MDLFDYAERYPNAPGYKKRDTARAAAKAMKPKAPTLRAQCLAALKIRPMTADEVAAVIGRSPFSIRPRLTELSEKNLIVDTGVRRENESGKMAIVWSVA